MSQTVTITATQREGAGKGVNRKLRAKGSLPAVVYGHHYEPVALSVNALEMDRMFRPGHEDMQDYQLYKLVIEGPKPTETMVVIKDIQRDPLKNNIRHLDFFAVRMDEKIIAPVHLRLVGKSIGVKNGGVLRHIIHELKVKSLPADVPPRIEIDISALEIGDSIHVKDLQVSANVQIMHDPEAGVVNVMAPAVVKEEKPEEAAAAAPAAAAASGAKAPAAGGAAKAPAGKAPAAGGAAKAPAGKAPAAKK